MSFHFGRAWTGNAVEDACPCPQAACGLAVVDPDIECDQHNPSDWLGAKTMRQIHTSAECPALTESPGILPR